MRQPCIWILHGHQKNKKMLKAAKEDTAYLCIRASARIWPTSVLDFNCCYTNKNVWSVINIYSFFVSAASFAIGESSKPASKLEGTTDQARKQTRSALHVAQVWTSMGYLLGVIENMFHKMAFCFLPWWYLSVDTGPPCWFWSWHKMYCHRNQSHQCNLLRSMFPR